MKRATKQLSLFECMKKKSREVNVDDNDASDMLQLSEAAKSHNCYIVPTAANGSCMFSAVAEQLGRPMPDGAKKLRAEIVEYLKCHPEIVEMVDFKTEQNMSLQQYIDYMSNDNSWGDGIILETVVIMFERPVTVLQTDGKIIKLTSPKIEADSKPIRLGFAAASGSPGPGRRRPNHYVSLHEYSDAEFQDNAVNTSEPQCKFVRISADSPLGDQPEHSRHAQSTEQLASYPEVPFDIGTYIDTQQPIGGDVKLKLLRNCWVPPDTYDFKFDASGKRVFRRTWLTEYSPWLCYSKSLKGAVCRYCVLFPQKVSRGLQGAFIVKPFTNYNDFHESARNHASCTWHKASHEDATNFIDTMTGKSQPVDQQLSSSYARVIEENRGKLYPIVSCIVYCGRHDIALRGKTDDSGNVHDLMHFRMDAGDTVLKNHLQNAAANAKYTSHRTQNEIIGMCSSVVRDDIVRDANASVGFSILADETTDISGIEQLSIGVRFLGTKNGIECIREEFLGFVPLTDRTAKGIGGVILKACCDFGLNLGKLVGQGYDGCSTMAGKEAGVQEIVRGQYPRAAFVHCSSHRLNLVVNDLNKLNEVRNAIGTVKSIIKFFRENAQRRRLVPNIPLLCETRWTHKYRSIRVFAENFVEIMSHLRDLSQSGVAKTRDSAHQLLCAAQTPSFLVALVIMKKYSSMLEPVTQALQAVQLDLLGVQSQIKELLEIVHQTRKTCESPFTTLFAEIETLATAVGTHISSPRQAKQQTNRANPPSCSAEEYYRRAIYIPYLDSLITSLETRFADENAPVYCLFELHPRRMAIAQRAQFAARAKDIASMYAIDNFVEEACTWYDVWANRTPEPAVDSNTVTQRQMPFIELLDHTTFFPAVRVAICIALAIPATTCTTERSFSTLRPVKTWLRSTMSGDRLSGLCMMSVHRENIMNNNTFIHRVIDVFGQNPRRMQFLFE